MNTSRKKEKSILFIHLRGKIKTEAVRFKNRLPALSSDTVLAETTICRRLKLVRRGGGGGSVDARSGFRTGLSPQRKRRRTLKPW